MKYMHWVPEYYQKSVKISLPNQTSNICHILADISGLGAYYSKPIFALKPLVWAGRFECHKPYNPHDSFSPLKGSEPFWGVPVADLPVVQEVSHMVMEYVGKQWELINIQHFCFFEPPLRDIDNSDDGKIVEIPDDIMIKCSLTILWFSLCLA